MYLYQHRHITIAASSCRKKLLLTIHKPSQKQGNAEIILGEMFNETVKDIKSKGI